MKGARLSTAAKYATLMLAIVMLSLAQAVAVLHFIGLRDRLLDARADSISQASLTMNWAYNGSASSPHVGELESTANGEVETSHGKPPGIELRINDLLWAVCQAPYRQSWPKVFGLDEKQIFDCINSGIRDDFGLPRLLPHTDLVKLGTAKVIDWIYSAGSAADEHRESLGRALVGQRTVYVQRKQSGSLALEVSAPIIEGSRVVAAVIINVDCSDIDELWRKAFLVLFAGSLILSAIVLAGAMISQVGRPQIRY